MKFIQLKSIKQLSILGLGLVLLGSSSCTQSEKDGVVESEMVAPKVTIQEAAFFGNTDAMKKHISAKTDLNQKDDYGSTPLHIASTFGKTEVARLLIEGGADLNATSADGSTPLHIAAFYGRTEIVKALLTQNADVSIRNSYKATALESVETPFENVKPVYDQLSKDLGGFGLRLDYDDLEASRPVIAELIKNHVSALNNGK